MYTSKLPKQTVITGLFFFLSAIIFSCTKVEDVAPVSADDRAAETSIVKPSNKPNIILILGDDIGYEVPTYTGGQSYSTPNIDNLAKKGMQFTNCYSLPMCSPSRTEMLTGKYNNRNYGAYSWGHLDAGQKTFANMLHNAGYITCITGKWQFDGGDSAIHGFGFDKYSVTNPYKILLGDYDQGDLSLYKNPTIYQYGAYLPTKDMKGKYGEDVNRDYLFKFIDSNKNKSKPFFAMWTPNLCHAPFSPTPDDPEFASWDPTAEGNRGDISFFPSMMKYFDKEVGMLMTKLQNTGLYNNTIVLLVVGDNGTDDDIKSMYNGELYKGGKGFTFQRGIHVPMIAFCPNKIAANAVNKNLVDFSDFMPTLADIAKVNVPANYGVIDGKSFSAQLFGNPYTARTSSFGYYDANRWGPDNIPPTIYAMDYNYKQYDDSLGKRFYNYLTDMDEKIVITPAKMTIPQRKTSTSLDSVIHSYLK